MSSVLKTFTMNTGGQLIGQGVEVVDPHTRQALENARQDGYQIGFEDGMKASAGSISQLEAEAGRRLEQAVEDVRAHLSELHTAANRRVLALVFDLAKTVISNVPDAVAESLQARLLAALDEMDDEEIRIRLNPDDHGRLAHLLPAWSNPVADPSLGIGDAMIDGRWSQADLRLDTAWSNLLGAGE